ncbi:MAG: hypothetical protein KGZ37_00035 [Nitrosarchaeum sp.]|nr:hypothetical protein [Nitrosarchaeum sp.]
MTTQEIHNNLSTINSINTLHHCDVYSYSATLKFTQFDDFIVHKIELINNSFDESISNTSIELNGVIIGDLFYLKDLCLEISSMSIFQFYAFLNECTIPDLQLQNFTFRSNYLVVHKDYIDDFHLKYSSTSSVWGGFKISENQSVINYYKKTIPVITIPDELKELDHYAQDSVYRALDQKHSFERFLKLYHLLELEFDYSLIKKIQSLNITTDSNLIGNLLNEYKRTESDRLFDLISNNCFDTSNLSLKLNNIKSFITLGEEIFIRFGKEKSSNFYLTDSIKYNALLSDPDAFTNPNSVKTYTNIQPTDYPKFIHTITSYWIYRIRCSIAHFKIGEYILTRDKEDFIVEFAEPLIKEVLIQFYKK